jgi:hypothetical protein
MGERQLGENILQRSLGQTCLADSDAGRNQPGDQTFDCGIHILHTVVELSNDFEGVGWVSGRRIRISSVQSTLDPIGRIEHMASLIRLATESEYCGPCATLCLQLFEVPLRYDLTAVDHNGTVARRFDLAEHVGAQKHRSRMAQLSNKPSDLTYLIGVETSGRLVQNE